LPSRWKTPGINLAEMVGWGGVAVADWRSPFQTQHPIRLILAGGGVRVMVNMQELITAQELRQLPAAWEVNLRPEVMCREPDHPILVYLTVCERHDTPKLTLDLRKIGFWTGVLLFDIGLYYGLTRLVMWATSL
jgi:hypothetical protein